jgi:ElaB/YqjD/DUF883 family membrane-anchored ribosome-binding protein
MEANNQNQDTSKAIGQMAGQVTEFLQNVDTQAIKEVSQKVTTSAREYYGKASQWASPKVNQATTWVKNNKNTAIGTGLAFGAAALLVGLTVKRKK